MGKTTIPATEIGWFMNRPPLKYRLKLMSCHDDVGQLRPALDDESPTIIGRADSGRRSRSPDVIAVVEQVVCERL